MSSVVGSMAVPAKRTSPPGSTAVRKRPCEKVGSSKPHAGAPPAAASFATNAPVVTGVGPKSYVPSSAPATTTFPARSAPIASSAKLVPARPKRRLKVTGVKETGSMPPPEPPPSRIGSASRTQTPPVQASPATQSAFVPQLPSGA